MPPKYKTYNDFTLGVINVGKSHQQPINSLRKSQQMYLKDGLMKKIPGLVEINNTAIGSDPVWSNFLFRQTSPNHANLQKEYRLAASGGKIYLFNESTRVYDELYSGLVPNKQIEFLEDPPFLYFGSQYDKWRRFDGGTVTYPVGGDNGNAGDAPRMFKKMLYNPYAQRYFGIGELLDINKLRWSEHIDNGGIEIFPASNNQIIESVNGDTPQWMEIYEGRINIFSQNSISSGTVEGVPEIWSFQREKSQAGALAGRTVKRHGSSFLMLTPSFEVYAWPDDVFITKERIVFDINPYFAHLACAEIVDGRYYYLSFVSGDAVSSDKYTLWIYDILGKRWSGPHVRYNVVSMHYDPVNATLNCGGADELAGFVLEHRGRNIKNRISPVHIISNNDDYGTPRVDKRYSKLWVTASQEGSDSLGTGNLQVITTVDGLNGSPQSQLITLEDPANQNLSNTSVVRDAVTKRGFINEDKGRGNRFQYELKHEISNGDLEFSALDVEYYPRTQKENRAA